MKKMFKAIAAIAAILSMANFVACKSDDDNGGGSDGSGTETVNLAGTYWVVEDEEHTDGNATVKFTNESYIYIKDGSNGTLSQIEEWEFSSAESKTYTSENYVDTAFTYTVTDSGITITSGTDTATAILSEDGNSIIVTLTVDGETVKSVYNKATAAPEKATLVVTVTSSSTEDETTDKINLTVDITSLDFTETTTGLKNTAASGKNGTFMIPATTTILDVLTPAKDDKAYWYTDKALSKIAALQLNDEGELKFTLSGAATVKVTFLSTGDSNTSAITVNGTQNSVTGKTAAAFIWEITAAGDYTIASTGTSNARITALSIVEK